MTITPEQLEEWQKICDAAFKAPWTYRRFAIDCGYDDCVNDECQRDPDEHQGAEHEIIEVESPDEDPDGQCVAQIHVPGLEMFAEPNGKFIAEARTALPQLIAEVRRLQAEMKREACRKAACSAWYKADILAVAIGGTVFHVKRDGNTYTADEVVGIQGAGIKLVSIDEAKP